MPQFTKPRVCHYGYDLSRQWFVYFYCEDPASGKKIKRQHRGEINRHTAKKDRIRAAGDLRDAIHEKLKEGWNPLLKTEPIQPRTLGQELEEVFNIKMAELTRPDSKRTYRYIYRHFASWLKVNYKDGYIPSKFSYQDAISYTDTITMEGKGGRAYNNYRSVVSLLFNMMASRDIIEKNPFIRTKRAKINIGKNLAFNPDQLLTLRTHMLANQNPLYNFCQFMFYTFIRPMELLHLQIKHIDFLNNKIHIPAEIAKNRRQAPIEITPSLLDLIAEMKLDLMPADFYIFSSRIRPGPKLIIRRDNITAAHVKVLRAKEFGHEYTLYSWKHSGVCAAYRSGVPIYDIMRQCRHSSLDQTQIYLKTLGMEANTAFQKAVF